VAIDPGNPSRAYVVIPRTNSIVNNEYQYTAEVMVSEDRGVTWRGTGLVQYGLYIGANDDYRVESGERLAVDPNNSNVLYFASRRNGLWKGLRQSNAQYTWAPVSGGLPPWTTNPATDAAGYTFVLFDSRATSTACRKPSTPACTAARSGGRRTAARPGPAWAVPAIPFAA
jgi:xyloglucan-specific exo-beta-1,4-glucanase